MPTTTQIIKVLEWTGFEAKIQDMPGFARYNCITLRRDGKYHGFIHKEEAANARLVLGT